MSRRQRLRLQRQATHNHNPTQPPQAHNHARPDNAAPDYDDLHNPYLPLIQRQQMAQQMAHQLGNRQAGVLLRQVATGSLQRDNPKAPAKEADAPKRDLNPWLGQEREEKALFNLFLYALHHPQGPLDFMPDPGFGGRVLKSFFALEKQLEQHESFDKAPARLKAIIFALEELNVDAKIDPQDAMWMTSREGSPGERNPKRSGSTSAYGPSAWKCNKFVADAYASKDGAGVGKQYPLKTDKDEETGKVKGVWGPQANDLASGTKMKNFPVKEIQKIAEDGVNILEIVEYDDKGREIAIYKLDGKVFAKYEKQDGQWAKTGETKQPEELAPGFSADIGDIVSFKNVERGVSGHTGLNLGNDLFISALNATSGVGIVSISQHLDPDNWDKYSQVTFRRYGR